MSQIQTDAVARLVMMNGSLVSNAEVAQILESYRYEQDTTNPSRWALRDEIPQDISAALEFSSNNQIIDVYSNSDENIINLNYIVMRVGWSDCEIYAINQEIEHKLLQRLANVNIANPSTAFLARSGQQVNTTPNTQPAPQGLPIEEVIDDYYQQLQQLRITLAEAEQRNEELREDKQHLETRIQQLEVLSETSPASIASKHPALLKIIEKHLLPKLDLSAVNQSGLMTELKEHGYRIEVRLVHNKSENSTA